MTESAGLFEQFLHRTHWHPDRMILDDLVFRLEHYRGEAVWDQGDDYFRLYKTRELLGQFGAFWSRHPGFSPKRMVELGIWDGASAVVWFEVFKPDKLVAVDVSNRGDSEYFRRYLAERDLSTRLRTYWGVDQADVPTLTQVVCSEFSEPLDLVVDDASHVYEPTKASFEVLFPLLRPGGLYVIEDWAWAHWPEFADAKSPFSGRTEPSKLVFELTEATGSSIDLISSVTVMQGFVAIERGPAQAADGREFALSNWIVRRPQQAASDSARVLIRKLGQKVLRRLGGRQ